MQWKLELAHYYLLQNLQYYLYSGSVSGGVPRWFSSRMYTRADLFTILEVQLARLFLALLTLILVPGIIPMLQWRDKIMWFIRFEESGDGSSARRRRKRAAEKRYRKAKQDCTVNVCGAIPQEENMNCIFHCISPVCFDAVYASDPLEDGEIDFNREYLFSKCAKKEEYERSRQNTILQERD